MQFSEFSKYLEELETTSSRLKITDILSNLFKKSSGDEIDKITYLSLGILAPNFKGIVFNAADQMMIRAISKAYGTDIDKVKSLYKQKGDLGLVSFELSKNKDTNLSVTEVYQKLLNAAIEKGEGSQERRIEKLSDIIKSLDNLSVKFVTRIPLGKLRLGFSEITIIDALSIMEKDDKSAKKEIEAAYNINPDIGLLAKLIKNKGVKNLNKIVKPVVGVPVVPMLAARLKSPEEMIKKMGIVSVEPKYDGLRIFIHFKKPSFVRIFTRNMNFIDESIFPELKNLGKFIKAHDVILDTEAVGVNLDEAKILDFQATMQRRRKHEVELNAKKTPLQFQVFDILLKDDESLIKAPYLERRKILEKVVINGPLLKVDEYTITEEPKIIEDLYKKYIKMGYEGVLVKKANGLYVSGRTGWNWVKMKQEETSEGKLSDTIDCVVMGYTVGKGKRVEFGIGQFLVGVLDESRGELAESIKTVTKVGTGLTDDQFRELKSRLQKIKTKVKPKEYEVSKILEPDFWVTPSLVVEIAADDITKSPNHTAGFALRFPRLVNFRDDKAIKDATTVKEVEKIYKLQYKK